MGPSKDFDVAIVGGGMCGIACAIHLIRHDIPVVVFEAAPNFGEVGAGVGLGPNALYALDKLGLLEAILSIPGQPKPSLRPFLFVTGTGDQKPIFDYIVTSQDIGLGIYRPTFLDALMPLLDPSVTKFNKRCTSVASTPSGRYKLSFADDTMYEADLVIGADGIKSITREFVVGDERKTPLKFTNTVAYRGLTSNQALKAAGVKTELTFRPLCWVGKDKHIITFPIQGGKIINIVAFATNSQVPVGSVQINGPWVEQVSEQEVLDTYSDFGSDAKIILRHLKDPSKWYIHKVDPPLQSYVRGKLALIGDAAHGMPPHLGAGVGQGFEDVLVLCQLLTHPKTEASNLDAVLKVYNTLRPPRANMVLQRSTRAGEIYENFGPGDYDIDDMVTHLAKIWDPVWHHDLDAEIAGAIEGLYATN